jgi:acetyl esterase/lipase
MVKLFLVMKEKYLIKSIVRKTGKTLILIMTLLIIGFISGCNEKPDKVPEKILQQTPQQTQTQTQSAPAVENESQPQPEYGKPKVFRDLAYATRSEAQNLDLYVPAGNGPFPLVVVIHGGGFIEGDKKGSSQLSKIKVLLKEGYATASINYRLSDEKIFPAQIYDAKTAVRYLRSNTKKYNLDPDHFGAWGASAGGTLAALLGTTCGVTALEGAKLGNAEQSSCIQAAVDWFGPIDILKMEEQFKGTNCSRGHKNPDSAKSNESKWVGAPIQSVPKRVFKTNPMNYIDASDPPFYIQHGTNDCIIPPEQSRALAGALIAATGKENVFYSELPGAGHGGEKFNTEENMELVVVFLDKYLR